MTFLLDTNLLLALAWEPHQHHTLAARWFRDIEAFATCPITQGGFLRISSNPSFPFAIPMVEALAALKSLTTDQRHVFWPDDLSFVSPKFNPSRVQSHKHVTDEYLVQLARHRNARLATFDSGLARLTGDSSVVTLILGGV